MTLLYLFYDAHVLVLVYATLKYARLDRGIGVKTIETTKTHLSTLFCVEMRT